MRAQRCIRNEVGLENALPERRGLKGTLEGGRVRKCTTQEIRAQRHTKRR